MVLKIAQFLTVVTIIDTNTNRDFNETSDSTESIRTLIVRGMLTKNKKL